MTTASEYKEDFLFLWHQVAADYSYLCSATWNLVREHYLPQAQACTSRGQFLSLLEQALDALGDFHVQLGEHTTGSPYPVPTAASCWAEWRATGAFITAVRPYSAGARAGLRAGQQLLAVNGRPVGEAARAVISPAADATRPAVQAWALLRLVTGYRGKAQQFLVQEANGQTELLTVPAYAAHGPQALLTAHRLPEAPDVGYMRLHNSLGDQALIPAFDAALHELLPTRGLLLDLRDTPSGGNTTVARAILGRFITQEIGYQKHVLSQEERQSGIRRSWIELASPRALPVYQAPVVVLVDRWTGSMGEGLAIGLGELAPRVQVVGTAMAGLRGALTTYELPHTQISFSLPTEELYTVAGIAREQYRPVPLAEQPHAAGYPASDPVLHAAVQVLLAARSHPAPAASYP